MNLRQPCGKLAKNIKLLFCFKCCFTEAKMCHISEMRHSTVKFEVSLCAKNKITPVYVVQHHRTIPGDNAIDIA